MHFRPATTKPATRPPLTRPTNGRVFPIPRPHRRQELTRQTVIMPYLLSFSNASSRSSHHPPTETPAPAPGRVAALTGRRTVFIGLLTEFFASSLDWQGRRRRPDIGKRRT